MRLAADRLEVLAGETLRAVAVVHPSRVSALARGALKRLVRGIVLRGFRDVGVFLEPPSSWCASAVRHVDWLLWLEATPLASATFPRVLGDLRIDDAWDARDAAYAYRGVLHPYVERSVVFDSGPPSDRTRPAPAPRSHADLERVPMLSS